MADPQNLMTQMLESIVAARQANPPPTGQERRGALESYAGAVRTAGRDTRAPYEVMMDSMLSSKNPLDPQAAMPAMFQGLENWRATQREAEAKREMLATKAMYDDVVARAKDAEGGSGLMTQLAHAALNPIQNIGGVGINRLSGQTVVPKALEGTYAKLYSEAFKAATEQRMPNPEQYAKQQADAVIQQHILANPSVAGSLYAQRPGQAPLPAQGAEDAIPEAAPGVKLNIAGMDEDSKDLVRRLIARYRANPNEGTRARLEKSLASLHSSGVLTMGEEQTAAPAGAAPTSGLTYKDVPKAEMEKGTAEVTGKELGKEHATLNSAMDASNRMITQLGLIEQLYATPNMPEGELGPLVQQVRSGLKSLGVDVGKEVGAADMARAVASNFALHLRTGEGTNLLPGAMSNYEDRLLQQMAPVLSLTTEGRTALVQFMREMSKSNVRLGHEANLLADKNRGVLPSDWRTRKERVMKEEMARLAEISRELAAKFQGAK